MSRLMVGDRISFKDPAHASMWGIGKNVGIVRQVTQSYRSLDERMIVASFGGTLVYVTDVRFQPVSTRA